ncbi:uncharacterized protein UV8b_05107 [Ustilaginoidea virens]|uniref:Uncharacterized protein n=1 Tax=Ustilaginoidea virens TaxID=1159556 RepID=A0A8E5MIB9_USTVR|nr:uncharacterized protein UV8b_05107 [Ustilaginoidea virens]QUC20866.1 hypothetical protein UV8b_05107 [Ustilaginoidea virens]
MPGPLRDYCLGSAVDSQWDDKALFGLACCEDACADCFIFLPAVLFLACHESKSYQPGSVMLMLTPQLITDLVTSSVD